jgi:prefoldin subunit 5
MKARNAWRRLTGRAAQVELRTVFERLDRQAGRIEKTEQRTQSTAKDAELHVREVNRIAPQLSALEAKVEDLRQALEATPRIQGSGDLEAARSLVDEIRAEHARIRVRLSAVTTYEERLRRIEEKLGLPHD